MILKGAFCDSSMSFYDTICDSTYQKVPVVRRPDFWGMGMQSQNISKCSPKVDFKISHTMESSILNLYVALRIWCKNSVFM